MGGFLSGLGTLLSGFNTARRIDQEGFGFREDEEARLFEQERQRVEAQQQDMDRLRKQLTNISLGAPQGEVDFNQYIPEEVQGARRERLIAEVPGLEAQTRPALEGQKFQNQYWRDVFRQGGAERLVGLRGKERQELAEIQAKLRAGMPITAAEQARLDAVNRRTDVMRDRGVGGFGGGGVGLTDEGLDAAARQYATTGQMPSLGMGAAGTRQAIINRAAELHPGVDIAGNAARYRAGTGALTNVTKVESAVTAFEDAAKRNAGLLRQFVQEIPDLGVRPLNQAARAIATTFGDTSMSEFNVALQSVRNEYARIISNPNLVGVMSDTARREGEVLLNPNATVNQILAALDVLETEARNRRESFGAVKSDLLGSFGGGETAAPVGAGGSGTADDPFVF